MGTRTPPAEPLVVIFGSTGTGKSDLAVELATRFNGEIINADAMQMYKGLPIITNKISEEERRGVPHHLLDSIGHAEETWVVGRFKQEATRLIREIRSRGRLPIVVGGTHYYINGLLVENSLVADGKRGDNGLWEQVEDGKSAFPILNASTEEVLEKLREVDPVMADYWHPGDRRKLQRSLEIYLTTGRRASDIYEEQRRQAAEAKTSPSQPQSRVLSQTLMFWVYSKPEVLNKRLNDRVDKMLDRGLMAEIAEMQHDLQTRTASGQAVERSKGILQSIGFKEFEAYLRTVSEGDAKEDLKEEALFRMKVATRQYAKAQVGWITNKTLPPLREAGALGRLFLLDSTNAENRNSHVTDPAVDMTRRFLSGMDLPAPTELSGTAREVLSAKLEVSTRGLRRARHTCECCKVTTVTEEAWQKHVKGRSHQKTVQRAKRHALVPEPRRMALAVADEDRPSSPDYLGLDFAASDSGNK